MSYLTQNDIARMRMSLNADSGDVMKRKAKKELLRQRSQEKMKSWPNTLDALRKKKERFVIEREEREEKERQEVDRLEAEHNRKARLATLDRANDMLFRQSDKMKMLKSQLAYSDALHTRKFQIQDKVEAAQKIKLEDERFHKIKMEKVRQDEEQEKAKDARRKQVIEEVKISRKEQLDDVYARRQAEADEAHAIGEAMRKQAKEQLQEEIKREEDRQIYIAKANADLVVANEKFKAIKAQVKQREADEMAQREGEVAEIEARKQARKDLAKRRFDAKQMTRQKIIDKAVELLAAKQNSEDSIQQKQAAEARAKTDAADAAKEAKRAKLWEEIVKSRSEMTERKLQQYYKDVENEKEMSKNWRQLTVDAEAKDLDKQRLAHEECLKIKQIQKAEAIAKARKKVADKLADREESRIRMGGGDAMEKKFGDTTREYIRQYAAEGKPIYPLLRALEIQQPPLLPALTKKVGPRKREEE